MAQSVTVSEPESRRLTIADVPPGAMFVSEDGDICLRSKVQGNIVTSLSESRIWFKRSRYLPMSEQLPVGIRLPPWTIFFDDTTPVQRVLERGARVVIEV